MSRPHVEELFAGQTLLSVSPACTFVFDALTGQILWANDAAYATVGVLPNMLDRVAGRIVPSERARASSTAAVSAAACWQYLAPSDAWYSTEATQCPVRLHENRGGHDVAVLVQFLDVAQESRFEQELHQTASYIEALSRRTTAGLLVLTDRGQILHATDRGLEQLALPRDGVIGEVIDRLARVHTADSSGWRAALAAMDPIATVRLLLRSQSDESVWLGGTLERMSNGEPEELLLTVHDISGNVRREQQRTRELEQENHRARYTMMGDLAMAVAHELGQPLAAANNFIAGSAAELQRAEASEPGDVNSAYVLHGLDNAARQIERAAKVISSMRSFVGHLDRVQQTVDLCDIVEECLYFVGLRAAAASVDIDYIGSSAAVRCERVLTGQVVMNLCFNAIEEMAEIRPNGPSVIRLRTIASDGVGMFVVEDQGRGIDRDPFAASFTSKADGSGIGLALCHRIITRQSGTIWARLLEQGGSQFGFSLPLATAFDR